jgi:hypothetical protein
MTGLAVPADLISISESETVLYPSRVSGWALAMHTPPLISGYALVTPGCWCMFSGSVSGVLWTAIMVIFCGVTFAARSSSYDE